MEAESEALLKRDEALLRYGNTWRSVLIAFTVLLALATVGVAIANLIVNSKKFGNHRVCLETSGQEVLGHVNFRGNDRIIDYAINYINFTGPITDINVYGPVPPGILDGPLLIQLCGTLSGTACDTTTVANQVSGKVLMVQRPIFKSVRTSPCLHYISLLSGVVEEARIYLCNTCGTPF